MFVISILAFQIGAGPTLAALAAERANKRYVASTANSADDHSQDHDEDEPKTPEEANARAQTLADISSLNDYIQGTGASSGFSAGRRLDQFGLFEWLPGEASALGSKKQSPVIVDYRNLSIKLGDAELSSRYSNGASALTSATPLPLELKTRGQTLVKSRFAVSSVAFFGDYLVFVEPGSYRAGDLDPSLASGQENGVQYLSFVDLKTYSLLLGDPEGATLPIFTVPVATANEGTSIEVRSNELVIKTSAGIESTITHDVLATFARMHATSMDVTAALVTPETYESAGPAVQGTTEYFLRMVQLAGQGQGVQAARLQEFARFAGESLQKKNANIEQLTQSTQFVQAMQDIQALHGAQSKFNMRARLLWERLSIPKPVEAPKKIREALAMMARGLGAPPSERTRLIQEGALHVVNNPYLKWGTGVAAAATLAIVYPAEFHHFLYRSLEIGQIALSGITGRIRGLWELSGHAFKTGFDGFTKPSVFYHAYLTPSRRMPFLIGTASYIGIALSMLALPILPVNAWVLARDLKQMNLPSIRQLRTQGLGPIDTGVAWFNARVEGFIERQRKLRADYLLNQRLEVERKAREHGEETTGHFTPEDTAEAELAVARAEELNRGWIQKMFTKVSDWKLFNRNRIDAIKKEPAKEDVVEGSEYSPEEILARKDIHSFGGALKSFLFATETIELAVKRNARGWHGFVVMRNAMLSPTLFFGLLKNPNFVNIALGRGDGPENELIVPSVLNGGMDSPFESGKRVWKVLTFDQDLKALEAWEKKIIPVEKQMIASAMRRGFEELVNYATANGEDIEDILRTGGITSMTDAKMQTLSLAQRTFFRKYVDDLMARSMETFLRELAEKSNTANDLSPEADLRELKNATINEIERLNISPEKAEQIVRAESADGTIAREATDVSKNVFTNFRQWVSTNLKYNTLQKIDPSRNLTMGQMQRALREMSKADAVPRALRAVFPQLFMKKTIGFLFTLFGFAGASGQLSPIQDQMFGPTSFMHLSRLTVLGGLLVGFLITVYEGVPQKLQRDNQHSAHFMQVPEGADAEMSFARWYFKQTFQNPHNTWWGDQKLSWKLFFGNLKPQFVLSMLVGLTSLARFDLDGFAVYLMLGTFNPTNGLDIKLEQGAEFASFYWLKDIPKRLWTHPTVQTYLTTKQSRWRVQFAFFEKIWIDAKGTFLGLFTRMSFPRTNSEAFLRLLDPGNMTPTERAWYFLEKGVREPLKSLPVIGSVVSFCEAILTTNYTNWQKVHPPGWVPPRDNGHGAGGHVH